MALPHLQLQLQLQLHRHLLPLHRRIIAAQSFSSSSSSFSPSSAHSVARLTPSSSHPAMASSSSFNISAKSSSKDHGFNIVGAAESIIEEVEEIIESVFSHPAHEVATISASELIAETTSNGTPKTAQDSTTLTDESTGDTNIDSSSSSLAQRWREIQGLNHWKGLLDPLDLELRKSILFYGDFNQAVYDAFETDEHSKYTGSCRFSKEEFFEKVGLVKGREAQYKVVRYLYATSSIDMPGLVFMKSYSREAWSKESNWIGYVAVSTDETTKNILGRRDIVIVWRGTMRPFEWLNDFDFRQADIDPLLPKDSDGKVSATVLTKEDGHPQIERGWLIIYTSSDEKSAFVTSSARDQVLNEVKCQLKKYKDEDVSITILGHSLGAALAVVNAFDIGLNGINVREGAKEPVLVTAIVHGCPGVGDADFKKKFESLDGVRLLRGKNKIDLITLYPGWLTGYRDVGDELLFDSRDSPYLKKSKTPGDWHNLEAHLHMVAGTQGVGKPFKLDVNRSLAVVNKSSEFLSDDYLVPGSWWQMQYKGLVQRDDGVWYMPDREEGKRPEPEPLNDL